MTSSVTDETPLLSKVRDLFHPQLPENATAAQMGRFASAGSHIFQPFYEGIRVVGYRDNKKYHLRNQGYDELSVFFPEVCEVLEKLPNEILIDGILCFFPDGDTTKPSNKAVVESRLKVPTMDERLVLAQVAPITFVGVDIITLGGQMLTAEPLQSRLDLMANMAVERMPHSETYADFSKDLKERGWPGVVAKKKESQYKLMFRTDDWMKYKF